MFGTFIHHSSCIKTYTCEPVYAHSAQAVCVYYNHRQKTLKVKAGKTHNGNAAVLSILPFLFFCLQLQLINSFQCPSCTISQYLLLCLFSLLSLKLFSLLSWFISRPEDAEKRNKTNKQQTSTHQARSLRI